MSTFDYGMAHPSGITVESLHSEALEGLAFFYRTQMSELYARFAVDENEALRAFDLDADNIKRCQLWAAEQYHLKPGASELEGLCLDFMRYSLPFIDYRYSPREVLRWTRLCMDGFLKHNWKPFGALCLLISGSAWRQLGDRDRTIELCKQSLELAWSVPDPVLVVESLSQLGKAYGEMGNRERAILCLEKALDISRKHGMDKADEEAMTNVLSYFNLMKIRSRPDQERKLLAISTSEQRQSSLAELDSLLHTGLSHWMNDDVDQAEHYFRLALRVAIQCNDGLNIARTHYFLGRCKFAKCVFDEAYKWFERSAEKFEEVDSILGEHARSWVEICKCQMTNRCEVGIGLVRWQDADSRPLYAYICVPQSKAEALNSAIQTPAFDPSEYGVVLEIGEGEPSVEVQERMAQEF